MGQRKVCSASWRSECSADFVPQRLHIALPSPDPKLGAIRQSLAEYSHVPIENIKLIFGGGIMKDDSYPSTSIILALCLYNV